MSTTAVRPGLINRFAGRVLGGPLAGGLWVVYLAMLAAWLPQYLSWPWWTDLDHFATFAMAWDVGVLPYRDLPTFQLPGEYYLFWVVGKVFGWGRTAPVYAVDAAAVVGLGAAMTGWSRRRFGRALPGVVGYGGFLCYYLGLGIHQVAQRDWHSALAAALGLFAAEAVPGRRGRYASALALAAAFSIRPQVVLLAPAFLLAVDGSARPPGGPWGLTGRAVVEWVAVAALGVALAFAPLVVAGTFDDFLSGLGAVAPGTSYNKLTTATLVSRVVALFHANYLILGVACAAALVAIFGVPGRRRTVLTWLAALAGAWFYKPLSPVAHVYLIHTLMVVSAVVAALLVGMILEVPRCPPVIKLALVAVVVYAQFSTWPRYVQRRAAWRALTWEKSVEFPRMPPDCGPMYLFYNWEEYRSTVLYLRRTVPADFRIANALQGLPAVAAPVGRLSALPEVSLSWFEAKIRRPGLAEAYVASLRASPRSVVVWRPREERALDNFMPHLLGDTIRSAYTFEARFGTIEVWRRLPGS